MKHITRLLKNPKQSFFLLGPRGTGKSTWIRDHFKTALWIDLLLPEEVQFYRTRPERLIEVLDPELGHQIIVIDEIQKVPHWSEMIKFLWDQDTISEIDLSVLILGSSPWLMQKGLAESLAGRFEIIPITHWSFGEMHEMFGWSLEHYLYFGGYPGAAPLSNQEDPSRWINYINDSIIETTISRDILLMSQVNKPVLLRRLFQLGCNYSGQILSYNKMLGELQNAGNSTTLAHYVDLLAGAGLLTGLQKFANQSVKRKGSSPKFAVYNTALLSAQSG